MSRVVAVPRLIQRFRARELQRIVDKRRVHPLDLDGTPIYLQDVDLTKVPTDVRLNNPFVPRPLFKLEPNVKQAESEADKDAKVGKKQKARVKKRQGEKNPKERKKWAQPHYSLRQQVVLVKLARASGTLHLLPPGPKLSVEELEAAKREAAKRAEAEENDPSDSGHVPSLESREDTGTSGGVTSSSPLPYRKTPRAFKVRSSAALGHPGVVFNWTGKVPTKTRKGLTIYAGRRRMFKGHKWERNLDKRRAQIGVRMRDMPRRIARFKGIYRRRRLDPLKPAAPRKKDSLPF